jgi:hypothetical protein
MAKETGKKKPKKHPGGRRTLYKPEMCDLVERLAMLGLKDTELAHSLKITEQTLNNWKRRYPEFFASIKNGREDADGNVARALYKRSIGFVCKRQQPFKLKRTYYDEEGRRCEEERVEIAEFFDQVPPDTAAAFIWLKNRRPDKWMDKPVAEPTGEDQTYFEKALKESAAKLWDDMPQQQSQEDDNQ